MAVPFANPLTLFELRTSQEFFLFKNNGFQTNSCSFTSLNYMRFLHGFPTQFWLQKGQLEVEKWPQK